MAAMEQAISHLRAIVQIAEAGSINRAATRLGLTQPAVSQALQRIETAFGGAVFTRSGHGLELTPLGEYLVARSRTLLSEFDHLVTTGRGVSLERADHPVLRIGGQRSPVMLDLMDRLAGAVRDRELTVHVDHSLGGLLTRLTRGLLDVIVVLQPQGYELSVPSGISSRTVVEFEPAYLAVAADDPLARHDAIDLADLRDRVWLDDPFDDSAWPMHFRNACREAGFAPRVNYWGNSVHMAERLVSSGRAVALYFPTATTGDGLVLRPILCREQTLTGTLTPDVREPVAPQWRPYQGFGCALSRMCNDPGPCGITCK